MTLDLSIDIETLGRGVTSAPLAIGWAAFDPFHYQKCLDPLQRASKVRVESSGLIHVDLQSCLDAGLTVDGATIQWWFGQSEAARAALFADGRAPSLGEALSELSRAVDAATRGVGRIWAKGPSFDIAILENAYRVARLKTPWKYNAPRDVRTIVQVAGLTDAGRPENSHNAMEDAIAQAKLVQEACAALGAAP